MELQADLLKLHDEELTKIRKLSLVIKTLKSINYPENDSRENIESARSILKIADYFDPNDKTGFPLNKKECSIELSYTERKLVRQLVVENLHHSLQPIIEFKTRMCAEFGDEFAEAEDKCQQQIIELEKKYRLNLEMLLILRNRKCHLLKEVVEIKSGPHLSYVLQILLDELRKTQLKAKVLRGFMLNELPARSERSMKAILEVQNYIESALDLEKEKH